MATLKAVRGTRDLLPPDTELWNRVEATARAVFARYGFGEIRTPLFETTELFARGVGEETDIVSKEMYTWDDRARAASEKPQSLTLRPENTPGGGLTMTLALPAVETAADADPQPATSSSSTPCCATR